jgi:hypothetical protein
MSSGVIASTGQASTHLLPGQLPLQRRGQGEPTGHLQAPRGITKGLLDVLDPRARLTAFVPRDPDEAGCVIEIRA